MTLQLVPGLRLARRDPAHLQLGVDPPNMAVLPDTADVRRLVDDLARGHPVGELSSAGTRALTRLVSAGLAVPARADRDRREALSRTPVLVEADPETSSALAPLLAAAGIRPALASDPGVGLLVGDPEIARDRLDPLVRDGIPHLVVTGSVTGFTIGPFVAPGDTACLRCLDAHLGERDPRRTLVLEQVAGQPPLTPDRPDLALRSITLAWAVRDLVTFLEGGRPATWSATVRVDSELDLRPHRWLRHPHCGCSWGDLVVSEG